MNMKLNIHQQMAVKALEKLKEICDRYEIDYYLLAGSTLGAVRHKGMIPWDDDIDIGLKYDDWYKLRKILPKELKNTEFVYLDNEIDQKFPRLFGKILYDGYSCIDIFLIARWTDNRFRGKIHWQIRRTAVEFYKMSIGYKSILRPTTSRKERIRYYITHNIRRLIYLFSRIFWNTDDYIKLAKWNEKFFEGKEKGWYINLYSIYKMEKEMIREEWIENPSQVLFEGEMYQTVGDTDAYLSHLYGDYMTPPADKYKVATHQEQF